MGNWESFHVFCDWDGGKSHVNAEQTGFDRLWDNEAKHCLVVDIPTAVRDDLLCFLPANDGKPKRLLLDPAYRLRIWDRTKARGAVPATAEGFAARLETATDRPVFLSLALGQDAVATMRDKLYVTGLAVRISSTPVDNIPQLAARWKGMHKDMDTGPLARNYLVPGAVLLKYYRATGNEAEASRLEHELRGLAQKTGSTDRMIKSGVFQH